MDWHKNMKMRSKLFLAAGMLVLLMALSNILTISQFTRVSRNYSSLINDTMQRQIYLLDANTDIMKLRYHNLSTMYSLIGGVYAEKFINQYGVYDTIQGSFE